MVSLIGARALRTALKHPAKTARAVGALALQGRPDIYCTFGGGVGDSLLCGSVVHELVGRNPNRRVWLEVPAQHIPLFGGYPREAVLVATGGLYGRLSEAIGASVRWLGYDDGDLASDVWAVPQRHLFQIMCEKAGIDGTVALLPRVHLSDVERSGGKKVAKIQIAIHSSGLGAAHPMRNKEWQADRFQAVVDAVSSDKIGFVQIGVASDPPLTNTLDLRGRLSLRETAAVLSRSAVFVGLVGGLMHLARSIDCRSVIIYGGREHPWQSGYAANENIAWSGECAPCWAYNRCDFDRRCMKELSATTVIEAVQRQLLRMGTPLPVDRFSVKLVYRASGPSSVPSACLLSEFGNRNCK